VLAILGPCDHCQPGVHGTALGDMIGDRVPQLGIGVVCVHESAVGPPPPPGPRIRVQSPAHDQAFRRDGLNAEQVAVGHGPAGLPRLDGVIIAGADDQVTHTGLSAVRDAERGAGLHDAQADELVADAAG